MRDIDNGCFFMGCYLLRRWGRVEIERIREEVLHG